MLKTEGESRMRRRATLVIALVLPVFASALVASAQPKPATHGTATPSASDSGAASPDPNAAPLPSVAAPAPAVSVDMNAKAPDAMTGGTYAVRLRDLEQRVDDLKDQIRRSHTRLALLSDTILGGGTAGSRAEVAYHNEMSGAFLLTRALFVMDGQIQYNRQDESGALADQKEIPVFTGSVPPGDHTIQVSLTFQGNGFGVFSYLRGYKFEVKSSHSFTALEGKMLSVTATSFEKGGATTPLEQRPTVEWNEKIQPLSASAAQAVSSKNNGGVAGAASAGGGQK
jgi:flagellar basal body-associated protein FliL